MTADLNKLTVVELRAELKKHGLPQAGKKAELVERLSSAVETGSSEDANNETANDEQAVEAQDPPKKAATPTPEPVTTQDEPIQDALEPVDITVPVKGAEAAPADREPSNETADASLPTEPAATTAMEQVATTTINISEGNGSSESLPPVAEVINDVQSRKRRSRTPSVDESVRKRLRPDDPEPRRVDRQMDANENGAAFGNEPKEALLEVKDQPVEAGADLPYDAERRDTNTMEDVRMEEKYESRPDYDKAPHDGTRDYPVERMQEDEPAAADYGGDDRPVVPAIHPATSALYIKNLMRPLRPLDVKDHLIALATPPSQEPNPDVIVDFYLDHIRTHAFVSFNSVSAASRVRSALHDQVWPDERNRKALWVDFIPADKVVDWIEVEEAEGGGRGKMNRWEVVYEADADGNMTARLEEAGPDTARPNPRPAVAPPTGPTSTLIPTGPTQPAGGVQGAPTGPRGRGGRMPPGYPLQGGVTPQEGFKATRAVPTLLYKPQSEEVARRRIDNMRSHYTKDRHRDMGPVEDINRYTFENVDSFVDRGKEVFVGIRPPHRERQMRAGGGGRPSGPRRGGPPPPSFRPRGDRYIGGRSGGGGGDSFAPRSRLDGAPLPTYDGPSGRRGRFGR
ncbi:Apoptotic chromatin condensation inducer in the nucleus [Coniochaeta hoffmannii]|uniref:Apoptotic chromatin condensation inducer in the nucleus n=1 Tax=Coniochaeta hoffmannii TaxID=91930 RepID=A0AA38RXQ6_9PEZI|nr:Apoptotic chromatin condensation inducer in the nucleus [Coniochaeta hoffmannii]